MVKQVWLYDNYTLLVSWLLEFWVLGVPNYEIRANESTILDIELVDNLKIIPLPPISMLF